MLGSQLTLLLSLLLLLLSCPRAGGSEEAEHLARGVQQQQQGHLTEAGAAFVAAVRASPASATAWANLAFSLRELKLPDQALRSAIYAVELDPANSMARRLLEELAPPSTVEMHDPPEKTEVEIWSATDPRWPWQKAFKHRQALDQVYSLTPEPPHRLHPEHPLNKELATAFMEDVMARTNDTRSVDPSAAVSSFCRQRRLACSWRDAMVMIAALLEKGIVGDPQNAELRELAHAGKEEGMEQWAIGTAQVSDSVPAAPVSECARIKSPTAAEFLGYVQRSEPVIIEGTLTNWSAIGGEGDGDGGRQWGVEYLQRQVGAQRLRLFASPDANFEVIEQWDVDAEERIEDTAAEAAGVGAGTGGARAARGEAVIVRPAEFEGSLNDFTRLVQEQEVRRRRRQQGGEGAEQEQGGDRAVFYLQKHTLARWDHLLNDTKGDSASASASADTDANAKHSQGHRLLDDLLPMLGEGWADFLVLKHQFLWLAAYPSAEADKEALSNSAAGTSAADEVVAPTHYDALDNLHAMVRGRKRFELFHPQHSAYMYHDREKGYRTSHLLYDLEHTNGSFMRTPLRFSVPSVQPFSAVNVSSPDYARHPLFRNAHKVVCEVRAGEIMYLPSFWWHQVTSMPDAEATALDRISIGVNHWYHPYYLQASDAFHVRENPLYAHVWSPLEEGASAGGQPPPRAAGDRRGAGISRGAGAGRRSRHRFLEFRGEGGEGSEEGS